MNCSMNTYCLMNNMYFISFESFEQPVGIIKFQRYYNFYKKQVMRSAIFCIQIVIMLKNKTNDNC